MICILKSVVNWCRFRMENDATSTWEPACRQGFCAGMAALERLVVMAGISTKVTRWDILPPPEALRLVFVS